MELITTEVERHFHDTSGRGAVCRYLLEVPPWLTHMAERHGPQMPFMAEQFSSPCGGIVGSVLLARLNEAVIGHVIYGPYVHLAAGNYRATFLFSLDKPQGNDDARLVFDVAADSMGHPDTVQVSLRAVQAAPGDSGHAVDLQFTDIAAEAKLEFRVYARGFTAGELAFRGVVLRRND